MRQDFDGVGSYDNQRISGINAERTVNMFEYDDPVGKKPKTLVPTSGLVNSSASYNEAEGGHRVTYAFKNAFYDVIGDKVYRVTGSSSNLVTSEIGTLTTTVGYVGVAANDTQIIFVDGQHGYIWDTGTSTFTQITDTSFPNKPLDTAMLDGFFVVINGDTNNFYVSLYQNGLVWSTPKADVTAVDTTANTLTINADGKNYQTGVPVYFTNTGGTLPAPLDPDATYYVDLTTPISTNPAVIKLKDAAGNTIDLTTAGTGTTTIHVAGQLQMGSVTSHPGTLKACAALHRKLFFFAENFTEVWENAGVGTNLPFRRNNALLMEVGTPAIGSVVTGFDRLFFLSQDRDGLGQVMEVRGSQAIPVSNRALDYTLAQYAEKGQVADAKGILIKENGLIFYRLNFTAANKTFVLGVTNSTVDRPRWHEEEMLNHSRHVAQTHVYFDGVNFYGDYKSPKLYIVDDTISTNDGESIRRMRITRQFTPPTYQRLRIDRFQLDLLQGRVDKPTVPNDQPTVFLQVSKDGGQTYGNVLGAPMGKIGERTFRTIWRKLGTTKRGQGFIVKIEFYNQIPFFILGASWAYEQLPE